jgi:hypothetical protein
LAFLAAQQPKQANQPRQRQQVQGWKKRKANPTAIKGPVGLGSLCIALVSCHAVA